MLSLHSVLLQQWTDTKHEKIFKQFKVNKTRSLSLIFSLTTISIKSVNYHHNFTTTTTTSGVKVHTSTLWVRCDTQTRALKLTNAQRVDTHRHLFTSSSCCAGHFKILNFFTQKFRRQQQQKQQTEQLKNNMKVSFYLKKRAKITRNKWMQFRWLKRVVLVVLVQLSSCPRLETSPIFWCAKCLLFGKLPQKWAIENGSAAIAAAAAAVSTAAKTTKTAAKEWSVKRWPASELVHSCSCNFSTVIDQMAITFLNQSRCRLLFLSLLLSTKNCKPRGLCPVAAAASVVASLQL